MTQETLREAVAVRFDFDGYGYQYMDSGSGSDWLTRKPDAEPLFTADEIDRRVAEEKARLLEALWEKAKGSAFMEAALEVMLTAFQQENSDAI
jgi:hypothetical protein